MWCVHAEQRLCVFCSARINFVCELSNHAKGYERHASRGGDTSTCCGEDTCWYQTVGVVDCCDQAAAQGRMKTTYHMSSAISCSCQMWRDSRHFQSLKQDQWQQQQPCYRYKSACSTVFSLQSSLKMLQLQPLPFMFRSSSLLWAFPSQSV